MSVSPPGTVHDDAAGSRRAASEGLFTDEPRPRRVSRCHDCGAPAPFRVQVVIAGVTKGGKPQQGKMRARSARYCEKHALDIWGKFGEQLA